MALWLREEDGWDEDDIVDTVAGLVKCAVMNEHGFISLASGTLKGELQTAGIPIAILSALFDKYVTLPQQNGKYLYITTVLELPDGHVQAGS